MMLGGTWVSAIGGHNSYCPNSNMSFDVHIVEPKKENTIVIRGNESLLDLLGINTKRSASYSVGVRYTDKDGREVDTYKEYKGLKNATEAAYKMITNGNGPMHVKYGNMTAGETKECQKYMDAKVAVKNKSKGVK
jgi:hypothetical protein